ncbi:MAG TPA: hypothetical protein VNN98_04585 [Rhizomicrobium sp.]|nr:hypothetical protein [Rhizomicrobium sp.]
MTVNAPSVSSLLKLAEFEICARKSGRNRKNQAPQVKISASKGRTTFEYLMLAANRFGSNVNKNVTNDAAHQ